MKRARPKVSVRIVYDRPGWAYHHRAEILREYAPKDFEVSVAGAHDENYGIGDGDFDIVVKLSYGHIAEQRRALASLESRALLVTSFNTGWPRKLDQLAQCLEHCDATVVNNREVWEKAGRPQGSHQISNGVDLRTFWPRVPPANRPPRALWCGSRYHRKMKRYEEMVLPLAAELERRGLPMETLLVDSEDPATHRGREEMAKWYSHGTVYVCASEYEGTPNTALEAAACGCTVVSTPVGNMPELIESGRNGLLVEHDLEALADGVITAAADYERLSAAMLDSIQEWDWRPRSRLYFELFRELMASRRRR